eukprot:NODE_411_length_9170_cov_0.431154.p6 type:complete len:113 gc:universal NODE_411_length_9170_cov_0.431154:7853-8191(+)
MLLVLFLVYALNSVLLRCHLRAQNAYFSVELKKNIKIEKTIANRKINFKLVRYEQIDYENVEIKISKPGSAVEYEESHVIIFHDEVLYPFDLYLDENKEFNLICSDNKSNAQ